ncbi:MAG: site-2 protease family protein [Pseudomonadota bacterium]
MFVVPFIFVLLLMWLVMAAPIGIRTIKRSVRVSAPTEKVWNALYPFGASATWHHSAVAIEREDDTQGRITTGHTGRDGEPIVRRFKLSNIVAGSSYDLRYTDDTSLADNFWEHHRQRIELCSTDNGTQVTLLETDRYRGLAFLVYRFFAMRRMARQIKQWGETGAYQRGGWFDRIEAQFAMAVISTLLIWPLFGLTLNGFSLAVVLTSVVALHELGHVLAFRLSGHKSARMVFLPLLGGIAMGGRPYNSHFEIAFAALMGAGFSAFLVVGLWLAYLLAPLEGSMERAVLVCALICSVFNLGNILPVWKFDGGQVLRQIFRRRIDLYLASFCLLAAIGLYCISLGMPVQVVATGLILVAALTLVTGTNTVKPRRALIAMSPFERGLSLFGLLAVLVIHAIVLQWSVGALIIR